MRYACDYRRDHGRGVATTTCSREAQVELLDR